MNMTIRQTCAYVLMASGMIAFAGCSAWGPSTKGEAQLDNRAVEGQSKSLAGVYEDVDSNGSIKSHPLEVGTEGQNNGVEIGGGPVDMPNIRTGQIETKGSANQTPRLKIGEKTMTPGSNSK
jgi:hypothetical protein